MGELPKAGFRVLGAVARKVNGGLEGEWGPWPARDGATGGLQTALPCIMFSECLLF